MTLHSLPDAKPTHACRPPTRRGVCAPQELSNFRECPERWDVLKAQFGALSPSQRALLEAHGVTGEQIDRHLYCGASAGHAAHERRFAHAFCGLLLWRLHQHGADLERVAELFHLKVPPHARTRRVACARSTPERARVCSRARAPPARHGLSTPFLALSHVPLPTSARPRMRPSRARPARAAGRPAGLPGRRRDLCEQGARVLRRARLAADGADRRALPGARRVWRRVGRPSDAAAAAEGAQAGDGARVRQGGLHEPRAHRQGGRGARRRARRAQRPPEVGRRRRAQAGAQAHRLGAR
eukprot:5472451-Prymnesium_polylepis.1